MRLVHWAVDQEIRDLLLVVPFEMVADGGDERFPLIGVDGLAAEGAGAGVGSAVDVDAEEAGVGSFHSLKIETAVSPPSSSRNSRHSFNS